MPVVNPLFVHVPLDQSKLPKLKVQTDPDGTRHYRAPNGLWYPSASTVVGWEKKDFFAKWQKDPANAAESRRAVKRGNMLHSAIEKYLRNEEDFLGPLCGNQRYEFLFYQVKQHLDKINFLRGIEVPIYSDVMQLAGRTDVVAEYDGELSIIDFKGSSRTKKEEWIEHYLLQATMYAIMWQERFGTPVKRIVVVIACEDGNDQVFVKNPLQYVRRVREVIQKYRSDNKEMLARLNDK